MKCLIITTKGLEPCVQKELKSKFDLDSTVQETVVLFETKKPITNLQSASRIIQLLAQFKFKTIEEIKTQVKSLNLKPKSFRIECKRIGAHKFSSQNAKEELADLVDSDPNFENPDTIYYCYIYNNTCYFGIDLSKEDISKREYKIFSYGAQIKGSLAFSLLMFSDYKKTDILYDPFCKSGVIPIEAALFGGKEIFAYDKNFIPAQKNAKIAQVDIKFENPRAVDKIITFPPQLSKRKPIKLITKIYNYFFEETKQILKKNGTITVLVNKKQPITDIAKQHNFKSIQDYPIMIGLEEWYVVIFVQE